MDIIKYEIVSKRQLWAYDGTTLHNKANEWKSNDQWRLRINVERGGELENCNMNKKHF